jgi:hypothetical protein
MLFSNKARIIALPKIYYNKLNHRRWSKGYGTKGDLICIDVRKKS